MVTKDLRVLTYQSRFQVGLVGAGLPREGRVGRQDRAGPRFSRRGNKADVVEAEVGAAVVVPRQPERHQDVGQGRGAEVGLADERLA